MGRADLNTVQRNEPEQPHASAWQAAAAYAHHLRRRGALPSIGITGIILERGETACFQTGATYARHVAEGDGSYMSTSTVAFGSPLFVAGALAAGAIGNAHRRAAATRAATPAWRLVQESTVIATDRRLLVLTGDSGWLSFWYSGVQEFYPELEQWHLVLGFPDTSPMRLSGLAAPYLGVHLAAMLLPDSWQDHPMMQRLLAG